MDATRTKDGAMVMLKRISKSLHPYEVEIGQYFSSEPLSSDSRNHCVPFYEILQDPTDEDTLIIVMPLLRRYIDPTFLTVGEAVECFRQLFEVRPFLARLLPRLIAYVGSALHARASCRTSVCLGYSCHPFPLTNLNPGIV